MENIIKSDKDKKSVEAILKINDIIHKKVNDDILEENGITSLSLITEIGHDPCLVIKTCDAESKGHIRGEKLITDFLSGLSED